MITQECEKKGNRSEMIDVTDDYVTINSKEYHFKAKLHTLKEEQGLTWLVIGDNGYDDIPEI